MTVDPTERFSTRVEDYARYRPRYPAGVLELLAREVGLTPDWVVADIGSGTGLSAEPFLDHGNAVYAVEPNDAMRAAAEALLGDRPGFRSVAGTAESTTLDPASVDLVVAAQAFHWFDTDAAGAELGRILRPGGVVALLWNMRRTEGTPFLRAYEGLLERYGTDYQRVRHDRISPDVLDRFFAPGYRRATLYNEQQLDREGLTGRVLSSSYTPEEGDPAREPMLRALDRLFAEHEHGGRVRLEYDTELYIGRPA